MAESLTETGTLYHPLVGIIFVFNLIVGTGALAMPRAFSEAGWILSMIMIILLAFISYVTATMVIEVMAISNAVLKWKRQQEKKDDDSKEQYDDDDHSVVLSSEARPLLSDNPVVNYSGVNPDNKRVERFFEITERVEMGQMASLFFNKIGLNLFYLCMILYLFGDLAIYAAAVPKSMRDVACTFNGHINNATNMSIICDQNRTANITEDSQCWEGLPVSRLNAYRLFLALFTLMLGPFVFFNVQKTKYLQIFTTIMRWVAFGAMVIIAILKLSRGEGEGHPPAANFATGLPTLFGVCVYSFMCHHSLPSLVTPIRDKSKIHSLFAADYGLILAFYSLLSFTGIFTFAEVDDLYTLNFVPNRCKPHVQIMISIIGYFLALFPVFTLSTNFPIIAITLRNNLKTMVAEFMKGREFSFFVDRIVFPLVTILPPIGVAFITHNVEVLVSITGSYAGAGIQYFIPVGLAFYGRRFIINNLGEDVINKHRSPFSHRAWLLVILLWAVLAIGFVTVNHIISRE